MTQYNLKSFYILYVTRCKHRCTLCTLAYGWGIMAPCTLAYIAAQRLSPAGEVRARPGGARTDALRTSAAPPWRSRPPWELWTPRRGSFRRRCQPILSRPASWCPRSIPGIPKRWPARWGAALRRTSRRPRRTIGCVWAASTSPRRPVRARWHPRSLRGGKTRFVRSAADPPFRAVAGAYGRRAPSP